MHSQNLILRHSSGACMDWLTKTFLLVPGADTWIATMTPGFEKRHKALAPLSRLGTGRGAAAYIAGHHWTPRQFVSAVHV